MGTETVKCRLLTNECVQHLPQTEPLLSAVSSEPNSLFGMEEFICEYDRSTDGIKLSQAQSGNIGSRGQLKINPQYQIL